MSKACDRTSNPWITDSSVYDPAYYKKALTTDNLWHMDYHIARVFSTPSYCNMLLLDLHGQIETSDLKVKPSERDQSFNHSPIMAIHTETTLQSIVECIETGKSTAREKELMYKGVAWYFAMSANLAVKLPEKLEVEYLLITSLVSSPTKLLFDHLIEVCGTRYSAEKARDLSLKILKRHLNQDEDTSDVITA